MPKTQLSEFLATAELPAILRNIHSYFDRSIQISSTKQHTGFATPPPTNTPGEASSSEVETPTIKRSRGKVNNTSNQSITISESLKQHLNPSTLKISIFNIHAIEEKKEEQNMPIENTTAAKIFANNEFMPLDKYDFNSKNNLRKAKNTIDQKNEYSRKIKNFVRQFFFCLSIIKTKKLKTSLKLNKIYVGIFNTDKTITYQNNETIEFIRNDEQLIFIISEDEKEPSDKEFETCVDQFFYHLNAFSIFCGSEEAEFVTLVEILKRKLYDPVA